jgi:endo-1,4-beta-xylanase
MNSMSPGNNMKAFYTVDIAASAKAYAEAKGDKKAEADVKPVVRFNGDLIAQLNWAKRNGFVFRGHTLVWHSQTAPEFFKSGYSASGERLSRELMDKRMDYYISEVMRLIHESWPGVVTAMDVVNEAVTDDGSFRKAGNEWYATFGDSSYVMRAFELARKYSVKYGEKGMKLYYNDYNTHASRKADGIVELCKPIHDAGYLDGIGMQDHDSLYSPSAADWISSYNKFSPVCDEMSVTEMDVTTGSKDPDKETLGAQANQYAALFKCFIERSARSGRGKIVNVSKDGLNDEMTFKVNQSSSLWDARYQCKPAFFAVVEVSKQYARLSNLIESSGAVKTANMDPAKRKEFTKALDTARKAFLKNYSADESAVDEMKAAADGLEKGM